MVLRGRIILIVLLVTWVFGTKRFKRKHRVLKRLEGTNKVLMLGNNDRLFILGAQLWEEYVDIVRQEESYWFQQAPSKWICLGDRNTHYFHQSTLMRRRRNKITALFNQENNWIYDELTLINYVTMSFSNLYYSSGSPSLIWTTNYSFPPFRVSDRRMLKLLFPLRKQEELFLV